MPHGRHIYAKSSGIAKATLCVYRQSDHALSHWKCVLRCCVQCSSINLPEQEKYDRNPNPSTSISFHIYHLIERCTKYGRLTLTDKKSCWERQHDTDSGHSTKVYTRKELVMTETTISNFYTSFLIPEIQKLAFHIPHVQILGTNHCGDSRQNAFKLHK